MTNSIPATGHSERRGGRRPRRRWSALKKRQIVAETYEPGQSVQIVAQRYDVNANQLFSWRREFGFDAVRKALAPAGLVPVRIVEEQTLSPVTPLPCGMITIVLPGGISIRVDRDVDDKALSRVLIAIGRPA